MNRNLVQWMQKRNVRFSAINSFVIDFLLSCLTGYRLQYPIDKLKLLTIDMSGMSNMIFQSELLDFINSCPKLENLTLCQNYNYSQYFFEDISPNILRRLKSVQFTFNDNSLLSQNCIEFLGYNCRNLMNVSIGYQKLPFSRIFGDIFTKNELQMFLHNSSQIRELFLDCIPVPFAEMCDTLAMFGTNITQLWIAPRVGMCADFFDFQAMLYMILRLNNLKCFRSLSDGVRVHYDVNHNTTVGSKLWILISGTFTLRPPQSTQIPLISEFIENLKIVRLNVFFAYHTTNEKYYELMLSTLLKDNRTVKYVFISNRSFGDNEEKKSRLKSKLHQFVMPENNQVEVDFANFSPPPWRVFNVSDDRVTYRSGSHNNEI